MQLAKIWWPNTEAELASVICLLEAEGIPHFVHGAGFGSVWPGLQIGAYNARTVMVPTGFAEQAIAVLAVLRQERETTGEAPGSFGGKVRLVIEVLLIGWFVPRGRSPSPDGT